MSPSTKGDQTDEEKLKGTYFAKSGTITVTPIKSPQSISIKSQGKRIAFKKQTMKLEFDAKLGTPFNTAESSLAGSVEFSVYWPNGKEAKELARRISTESMGKPNPFTHPPGTPPQREVSGKGAKKKPH